MFILLHIAPFWIVSSNFKLTLQNCQLNVPWDTIYKTNIVLQSCFQFDGGRTTSLNYAIALL